MTGSRTSRRVMPIFDESVYLDICKNRRQSRIYTSASLSNGFSRWTLPTRAFAGEIIGGQAVVR
jgi:hypothetical protein